MTAFRDLGVCICSAFVGDILLLGAASLVLISLVVFKPFPALESNNSATSRYDVSRYAYCLVICNANSYAKSYTKSYAS
jgi:hypothetical protein